MECCAHRADVPRPDSLMRVVDVWVNGKTLTQPITRISQLEIRDTGAVIRLMCNKNTSENYDQELRIDFI